MAARDNRFDTYAFLVHKLIKLSEHELRSLEMRPSVVMYGLMFSVVIQRLVHARPVP